MKYLTRIIIFSIVTSICISSCSSKNTDPYAESHFALGTVCTVTLYEKLEGFDFQEVFDLIDDIESRMSVQISASEVSAVNDAAGKNPVIVSEDTFFVIRESLGYSEASGGAFDITVQPLVELWGIGTEAARVPEEGEIDSALALTNYQDIRLDEKAGSIFLMKTGMAVDLGGIAKGYAADKAKEYLLDRGFSRGIINFGGNVIAFGTKASKELWKIGIQDPFDSRGSQIGIIHTKENSIVTSGIYERYFEKDGRVYHHILDTRTGYPVDNNLASVTIVTGKCITADAFSTMVFSLGIDEGMKLIESKPAIEGVFVTKDKEIITSSGLKDSFALKNTDYILKLQ
jgi:FAD:protein FMN transferase